MDRHTNTATVTRVWDYVDPAWSSVDLTGFGVEATDGSIGTIDESSHEVGASYLVVDTGPWIFGTKVMIPAGSVTSVNPDQRKVYVELSKDEIKDAPEFDEHALHDEAYRSRLGSYYGELRGR